MLEYEPLPSDNSDYDVEIINENESSSVVESSYVVESTSVVESPLQISDADIDSVAINLASTNIGI